jgi:hypothetical protein
LNHIDKKLDGFLSIKQRMRTKRLEETSSSINRDLKASAAYNIDSPIPYC